MPIKKAFTLIEVLVIVAIISLLTIAAIVSYLSQLPKARDAQRKAHIDKIKIAFEDYYSDNECYPPADILDNCAGDELAPHLSGGIPCDPKYKTPYCYVYDASSPCQNYRLLSSLENNNDQAITNLEDFTGYCAGEQTYNYLVASGNLTNPESASGIVFPSPTPTPTPASSPTPTPTPTPASSPTPTPTSASGPGPYACQSNVCNYFGYPNNCPISFASNAECNSFCSTAHPSMNCN
jgi:type II secretory pathway pseudopilin PulG